MSDYMIYIGLIFNALLSSISQILLNVSAKKKHESKIKEYLNLPVISAYVILSLVLVSNVYIMKFIDLKDAHVIVSTTYIFTLILSRIFLKEKLTIKKILGNILIIVGIIVFLQ